ncbi:recombinase RecT [Gemmata sp. JC717]|uniref:recombinase RecT n=1 Tax=Gemmata algarum TaxID=2975278 RepID=UPI0021BAC6C7|nr:recombinase RecT [Gemmata algarum]MDY3551425.1 recombinase RecT [Gemmata algarum]
MTEDLSTQPKLNPRQLAVVQRKNEIQSLETDLKKMLPPSIPSDKFVRTVQTAITLNPDLAEADKNSVLNSCMKAAADGLVLDGREAALTIYNVKQKDGSWKKVAQYIPMVAGIIKRVRNSGEVARLNAFVVYEQDTFHVSYGLEMTLKHEPNFSNPGKPIGAYAVCLFKDGEVDFEFMSLQQIEGIRERSKSKDTGPWKTDWSEMARKTVIRRLAKRLPVDSDIARVVQQIDEDYDMKPTGSATVPHDTDGVVLENDEGEKTAGKTRGAAAAKLNPKPKAPEPEPVVIENEPAHSETAGEPADDDLDVM